MQNDLPQSIGYLSDDLEDVCSHSAITMQCRVSRLPGYFVVNCLLPTLMITLCVFFTFLMDYSRMQYRFSLLFTTMLTSITFRWAIHGRVLPTISYLTFLDVYCVSSILIVFSCMVWHAMYIVLYKRDQDFAELADWYAMLAFAFVVILVHIMQTVWFVIAFRKRLYLERLDKKAALIYLKKRLNSKSQSNDSVVQNNRVMNLATAKTNNIILSNINHSLESKRLVYSFSKLDEKPIVQVQKKFDTEVIKTPTLSRSNRESCHINLVKEEFINNNTNNTSIDENELNSPSFIVGKNFVVNNLEEKTSLEDYQYLPLVHQSSRDS